LSRPCLWPAMIGKWAPCPGFARPLGSAGGGGKRHLCLGDACALAPMPGRPGHTQAKRLAIYAFALAISTFLAIRPRAHPLSSSPNSIPPPSGSHPHGRVQWAFLPPSAPPLPREFTPPVCCCISRRAVETSWRVYLWMKPRCLESAWGGGAPPSPSLSPSLSPTFGSATSRHSDTSSRSQLPLSLLRAGKDNPMLVELKNGETYNGILVNCDIWMNLSLRDVVCTSRVRHSHRTRHHHPPQNAYCLISRRTGSLVL
jgi:small nuclear ribonucleoprotein (snRNP)-like protein